MTAHLVEHSQTDATAILASAVALPDCALLSDLRHDWRGFFVGYFFYFGFWGYCETPTRAGAPIMLE